MSQEPYLSPAWTIETAERMFLRRMDFLFAEHSAPCWCRRPIDGDYNRSIEEL